MTSKPISTMSIYLTVVLILLSTALARAAQYRLATLDGKTCAIAIEENLPALTMILSSNGDTIVVNGFTGIEEASVINDRFLLVKYSQKEGEGIHRRNVILVAVKNDKLIESLHITSDYWFSAGTHNKLIDAPEPFNDSAEYHVSLNFSSPEKKDQALQLHITDYQRSNRSISRNYASAFDVDLKFNKATGVFYTASKRMKGKHNIPNPPKFNELLKGPAADVVTIDLRDKSYIYINKKWYLF
ncbi:MAG: hypothetical protein K0R82_1614 [Flavipsychrobacter sp.]|nr:hypothetical protein [Flavipsychrobacter sp.]